MTTVAEIVSQNSPKAVRENGKRPSASLAKWPLSWGNIGGPNVAE
jgi:hypothetical protein